MKYINEYPKVPGWYWARNLIMYPTGVKGVVEVHDDLTMTIPGWGEDDEGGIMGMTPDAEFAGPIPEPEEAGDEVVEAEKPVSIVAGRGLSKMTAGMRCWKQGVPVVTVMQGDRCKHCGIPMTSPSWNTYHFDPRYQP